MSDEVLNNVVPWGLHKVPDFVSDELKARAKRYGWNAGRTDTKAVRTAWLRICSNGMPKKNSGHPAANRNDGFIFYGVNGEKDNFYNQFGIRNNPQHIGYGVTGIPHVLTTTTFPNRPPPSIQSIEVEFYGAGSSFPGLCRKAVINWKCFSVEQLEYLTPYLMSARVSMVLEWGWNTYNPISLINLTNHADLYAMFSDGSSAFKRLKDSGGDYDCHVGRIIEYGYTMDSQGNYTGRTTVVNPSFMVDGVNIQNQVGKTKDSGAESLKSFMKNKFDNINSKDLSTFNDKEAALIVESDIYRKPVQKWREFEPTAKFWVNMRFVQRLFNFFCSVTTKNHGMLQYEFENCIIGAHPLMKAIAAGGKNTNVDVLIPNSNAPRLMRTVYAKTSFDTSGEKKTKVTEGGKRTIADANVPESFKKTAQAISKTLQTDKSLSDVSDDLQSLMKSVNSFPMYSAPPASADISSKAVPGFWGYLGDIYVSNVMLKDAVEENDTIRHMLEFLLGKISECGSNFWEFQIIPQNVSNVTVVDMRFNPITTAELAAELPNFVLGKTEDSSFQEYGMEVVMKNEMAMQTLLSDEASVDPKGPQLVKAFTVSDRLYDDAPTFKFQEDIEEGSEPKTEDEKKKEVEAEKERKMKAEEDSVKELNSRSTEDDCVILEVTDEKSRYFLIEKDPEFMKSMLQISFTEGISALSTPMMPDTPFTFKCQGIAGFSFLAMFTLSAIPTPYSKEHAVFQVDSVKHTIADNNWSTDITAKVRPLVTLASGKIVGS